MTRFGIYTIAALIGVGVGWIIWGVLMTVGAA